LPRDGVDFNRSRPYPVPVRIAHALLPPSAVAPGRAAALGLVLAILASCAHAPPGPPAPAPRLLRVATWNILFLNLDLPRVASDILASDADVVMMQEVTDEAVEALDPLLAAAYPHRRWAGEFGLVSRLPLFWDVYVEGEYRRRGVQIAALDAGDEDGHRTVLLANVHLEAQVLESPHPAAVVEVLERTERTHLDELTTVMRRLDDRFPHVIAGDFNSLPAYGSRKLLLRRGYLDAADEAAFWPPTTWADDAIFGIPAWLRIDYVYVKGGLEPVAVEARDSPASDHHLLLVDLLVPTGRRRQMGPLDPAGGAKSLESRP
jgi:endonuclease/exonuclease/phosphatase (EEP) superfamily protein YafD